MVEESSPLLPLAEESIQVEPEAALEPETESGESTPESGTEPYFVCECEEMMRSACEGLPFYKDLEDKRYCVLHYPGKEKSADFKAVLDNKLKKKDFDFLAVWFPDEVDFNSFEFSAAADFRHATFSAPASFKSAAFTADAYFSSATFSATASFESAKFSAGAYFNESLFHASVSFFEASFAGSVQFFGLGELQEGAVALGDNPSLDFQLVIAEHPDRIVFQTLILRPHWFVNVDSRSFVFTDVSWDWEHISINKEIAALKAKEVMSNNRHLAIACRQLAGNAEANNRYEEASNFRYWAMELQRQEMDPIWKEDWYEFAFW